MVDIAAPVDFRSEVTKVVGVGLGGVEVCHLEDVDVELVVLEELVVQEELLGMRLGIVGLFFGCG